MKNQSEDDLVKDKNVLEIKLFEVSIFCGNRFLKSIYMSICWTLCTIYDILL